MTDIDIGQHLAYTAGLFDGEGSVTIAVDNRNGRRGSWQLQVAVSLTILEPLERLTGFWGGSICAPRKRLGCLQAYTWVVKGQNAGIFLHDIQPWLIIKSTQARLALEYLNY